MGFSNLHRLNMSIDIDLGLCLFFFPFCHIYIYMTGFPSSSRDFGAIILRAGFRPFLNAVAWLAWLVDPSLVGGHPTLLLGRGGCSYRSGVVDRYFCLTDDFNRSFSYLPAFHQSSAQIYLNLVRVFLVVLIW